SRPGASCTRGSRARSCRARRTSPPSGPPARAGAPSAPGLQAGKHGLVGQAVDRAGAVRLQGLEVLGNAVALVYLEAVRRVLMIELGHHAVALDLGEDGGA